MPFRIDAEPTQIIPAKTNPNDPDFHYPPTGTEEAALLVTLDCEQFKVLGHTGRFLHGQIECAGLSGEDIGFENVPDESGYFVMERGVVSCGEDYADIDGDWRPATADDFKRFGADLPLCWMEKQRDIEFYQGPPPRLLQDISVEGNNGGSYVRIEELEADGMVRLEVGETCVVTIDQEISVCALAAVLTWAKDLGFEEVLREYERGGTFFSVEKDPKA